MAIFGDLVQEAVGGDFFTKISIPIITEGYKEILGVALRNYFAPSSKWNTFRPVLLLTIYVSCTPSKIINPAENFKLITVMARRITIPHHADELSSPTVNSHP